MLLLTACSSAPQPPLAVSVAPAKLAVVHPPLPAPVKLKDPKWSECQDDAGQPLVCLSTGEAAKELHNKAAVGKWMSSMSGIVRYYRSIDGADVQTTESK